MLMQAGDVVATYADIERLSCNVGFKPKTELSVGISQWTNWYKNYANQLKSY
jgi:UDP-glucuronate 4-epimerase